MHGFAVRGAGMGTRVDRVGQARHRGAARGKWPPRCPAPSRENSGRAGGGPRPAAGPPRCAPRGHEFLFPQRPGERRGPHPTRRACPRRSPQHRPGRGVEVPDGGRPGLGAAAAAAGSRVPGPGLRGVPGGRELEPGVRGPLLEPQRPGSEPAPGPAAACPRPAGPRSLRDRPTGPPRALPRPAGQPAHPHPDRQPAGPRGCGAGRPLRPGPARRLHLRPGALVPGPAGQLLRPGAPALPAAGRRRLAQPLQLPGGQLWPRPSPSGHRDGGGRRGPAAGAGRGRPGAGLEALGPPPPGPRQDLGRPGHPEARLGGAAPVWQPGPWPAARAGHPTRALGPRLRKRDRRPAVARAWGAPRGRRRPLRELPGARPRPPARVRQPGGPRAGLAGRRRIRGRGVLTPPVPCLPGH